MAELLDQEGHEPVAPADNSALNVVTLLERAVQAGMQPEALEKLVALQERILDRQAAAEFGAALAAFQAECPAIHKNRTVKVTVREGRPYTYSFAELDFIADQIRPLLAKHGFSYSFDTMLDGGRVTAVCILRHASGHSERTTFMAPADPKARMSEPQKIASATTYARRYALTLALGLTTTGEAGKGSDDDGMAAGAPTITDEQVEQIEALLDETGGDRGRFLNWIGAPSISDIPVTKFDEAVAAIKRKREKETRDG